MVDDGSETRKLLTAFRAAVQNCPMVSIIKQHTIGGKKRTGRCPKTLARTAGLRVEIALDAEVALVGARVGVPGPADGHVGDDAGGVHPADDLCRFSHGPQTVPWGKRSSRHGAQGLWRW